MFYFIFGETKFNHLANISVSPYGVQALCLRMKWWIKHGPLVSWNWQSSGNYLLILQCVLNLSFLYALKERLSGTMRKCSGIWRDGAVFHEKVLAKLRINIFSFSSTPKSYLVDDFQNNLEIMVKKKTNQNEDMLDCFNMG